MRSFLDHLFGEGVGSDVLPFSPVILNDRLGDSNATDRNYEVVVAGRKIGIFRFDTSLMRWVLIPCIGLGDNYDRFTKRIYSLGAEFSLLLLNESSIRGIDLESSVNDDHFFLKSGPVIGLARCITRANGLGEKLPLIKVCDSKLIESISFKEVSWLEVAHINEHFLVEQEEECIAFLREVRREYGLPVTVAFSGGKDSTATLLLAEKAFGEDFTVLYVDTGIEFPESRDYVIDLIKAHNLTGNFRTVTPERSFWNLSEIFGPPARDYRWCCKVLKFAPIAKYIRANFSSRTLTLTGKRKYESKKRQIESKVEPNRWLPGQILVNPIRDWSSLQVWLYLFLNDIPINPVYQIGVDRLSCWICPGLRLAEILRLQLNHPELNRRLLFYLRRWSKAYGFSEEWISSGAWRTLTPTKYQLRNQPNQTFFTGDFSSQRAALWRRIDGYSLCSDDAYFSVMRLNVHCDIAKVFSILKPFDPKIIGKNLIVLRFKGGSIQVSENGLVQIRSETKEIADKIGKTLLRHVLRATLCIGCGLCVSVCPSKARQIVGEELIINDSCAKCHVCQDVKCPIDTNILKDKGRILL